MIAWQYASTVNQTAAVLSSRIDIVCGKVLTSETIHSSEHVIANVFDTVFVSIKELCTLGVIDETRDTIDATIAGNIADLVDVIETLFESIGKFVGVEKHVIEVKNT